MTTLPNLTLWNTGHNAYINPSKTYTPSTGPHLIPLSRPFPQLSNDAPPNTHPDILAVEPSCFNGTGNIKITTNAPSAIKMKTHTTSSPVHTPNLSKLGKQPYKN